MARKSPATPLTSVIVPLTTASFIKWLLSVIDVLLHYGPSGDLFSKHLRQEDIVKPADIPFIDYLALRCPTTLAIYNVEITQSQSSRKSLFIPSRVMDPLDLAYELDKMAIKNPLSDIPKEELNIFAKQFDEYKTELKEGCDDIWAALITHWLSPAFVTKLKANPKYKAIALLKDIFGLADLIRAECQKSSGDRIGDVQTRIDAVFQNTGMCVADVKGQLDPLFEELALCMRMQDVDDATKMRTIKQALNPVEFKNQISKMRKTVETDTYEGICQQFQDAEDSALQFLQAQKLFSARTKTPLANSDKLLLAADWDLSKPHCIHCLKHGKYFSNHTSENCGVEFPHKNKINRTSRAAFEAQK